MSIRIGIGLDVLSSAGIDADATTIYNRIIADGGVSNLTRLNFFVKGLKTIYGSLTNVPVCYDAHWIGYKLGSGTGATAGQAVAKLYTISVIQTVSDSDAQAFIYRVYNAGGELTNTEASAVNQLVLDMKSAGVWTAMKAVYPMVGASAAACAQNLKSSSFTGTFNGGWTFASSGVTPNGTNAYMNTFLIPFVQMSNFSLHHSVYTRTLYGTLQGIGIFSPTRVDMIVSGSTIYSNIGSAGTATATNSISLLLASRTTATLNKLYTRGILRNTDATLLSVALPNANYYIGAENQVTPNFYSNTEIALSSLGDGLNDTQVSDFYTAVQAFQTTLSRQV